MADTRAAALLLGGAAVLGTFVIGKAAIDHILEDRGPVTEDLDEFESQHYWAAGFRPPPPSLADDLVAFSAAIVGIIAVLKGMPAAIRELDNLMK